MRYFLSQKSPKMGACTRKPSHSILYHSTPVPVHYRHCNSSITAKLPTKFNDQQNGNEH